MMYKPFIEVFPALIKIASVNVFISIPVKGQFGTLNAGMISIEQ